MGAVIVVDAFWGDAGKGKFSAYLSQRLDAEICVRAGIGPNAGHSIFRDGDALKLRLVPLGLVNRRTRLMIGSGVAVDPTILLDEMRRTKTVSRVLVDYRCPIIERWHKSREERDPIMRKIDSTKTGSGAARADYVMRRARRAADVPELARYLGDVASACNIAADKGTVVIEGSQATFLSLYLSDRYPYTTSDNATAAAFIDDVGLSWQKVDRVLLLVKCLPTAVGGGPLPNEMTRREIRRRGLVEFGTITRRWRRRIKGIDFTRLRYAVMINGATEIGLTHCDQFAPEITDCRSKDRLTKRISRLVARVERETNRVVRFLDTGKEFASIIEL